MIITDGVYLYEKQELENGGVATAIVGNFAKIEFQPSDTNAVVGRVVHITIVLKDWQGNTIVDQTPTIAIAVDGPGESDQDLKLTIANGVVEFDFASNAVGIYKITAVADIPCDKAFLEVVVSEA